MWPPRPLAGTPDGSFGDAGMVVVDLSQELVDWDQLYALAIQPDGRIVGSGSRGGTWGEDREPTLFRFESNGRLDLTFGNVGKVTASTGGSGYYAGLAMQPDGKLLAVGTGFGGFFLLARYDGLCPTLPDGDGDGVGDACDPCTNGVATERAVLKLLGLTLPEGDDVLRLKARFTLPGTPVIDPATTGGRVRVETKAGAPFLDVVVPPGLVDPDDEAGWRVNAAGTRFSYNNKGSALAFLDGVSSTTVKVNLAGEVSMRVKGKGGRYAPDPADPPRSAPFVVDAPRAEDGRSATVTFADVDCTFDSLAGKLRCH